MYAQGAENEGKGLQGTEMKNENEREREMRVRIRMGEIREERMENKGP